MNAEGLLRRLCELSNSNDAEAIARYMKAPRQYLGVRVPVITQVAREYWKTEPRAELIETCETLWETDIHEARVLVGKLLEVGKFKDMEPIWKMIGRFKEDFDGWAIADHLEKGAKRCILENETCLDELEDMWLPHSSFWVRRACLVYTLEYSKPGRNPERSLRWAVRMVDDREWFIQKAIGWWLRELSKHNPERVRQFLEQYGARMKHFAVKEASKYLCVHE